MSGRRRLGAPFGAPFSFRIPQPRQGGLGGGEAWGGARARSPSRGPQRGLRAALGAPGAQPGGLGAASGWRGRAGRAVGGPGLNSVPLAGLSASPACGNGSATPARPPQGPVLKSLN